MWYVLCGLNIDGARDALARVLELHQQQRDRDSGGRTGRVLKEEC